MKTNSKDDTSDDPMHHVDKIARALGDLLDHCREDVAKVTEPKAQVLFETTAEVLGGLRTAYQHYATSAEPAMSR